MKLSMLIPEFPAQTHAFFWREIEALKKLGVDVSIISTRKPDLNLVNHAFAKNAARETFYLHPPTLNALISLLVQPLWLLQAMGYALSVQGLKNKIRCLVLILNAGGARAHMKKHGVTHAHGHSCANVAHLLAMVSLAAGPSYSLSLHGGLDVYGDNHTVKFQRAKFVATVTRPLQKDVRNLTGWDETRVPHISMGVDLAKFEHIQPKKIVSEPIRFITVARLAWGKGHNYSLEALAQLKQEGIGFHYTIVGGGPHEDDIRHQVTTLSLADNVTFKGTLGQDDVIKALQESHVLLLTSEGTFEAAPVCVMEAMAAGLPTITSIIGGTPDMIDDGKDGYLVEQRNVSEILSRMKTFIENPEILYTMGQNAKKSAWEKFSHHVQAKKLLDKINQ